MKDKAYVANPTGTSPTYTVELYFQSGASATFAAGDVVVDMLTNKYTVTNAGIADGAKRTGVQVTDAKGVGVSPSLGWGMVFTPTAALKLSLPAMIDVASNQTTLHTLLNDDMAAIDAGVSANAGGADEFTVFALNSD